VRGPRHAPNPHLTTARAGAVKLGTHMGRDGHVQLPRPKTAATATCCCVRLKKNGGHGRYTPCSCSQVPNACTYAVPAAVRLYRLTRRHPRASGRECHRRIGWHVAVGNSSLFTGQIKDLFIWGSSSGGESVSDYVRDLERDGDVAGGSLSSFLAGLESEPCALPAFGTRFFSFHIPHSSREQRLVKADTVSYGANRFEMWNQCNNFRS